VGELNDADTGDGTETGAADAADPETGPATPAAVASAEAEAPAEAPGSDAAEEPAGSSDDGGDHSDWTDEERAVVAIDSPLARLLDDRRVRIGLVVGIPALVALFAAVGILASNIGIVRVITVEGPPALAPGTPSGVRVNYSAMNELGLPVERAIDRIVFEVCPAGAPACLPMGRTENARRGRHVEVDLAVPDVPRGEHPVRLEVAAAGETVSYRFPMRFDPEVRSIPAPRDSGRVPAVRLGRSGILVDLVGAGGGVVRDQVSTLLLRARDREGRPHVGDLHLLAIGDQERGIVPPRLATDPSGLAAFDIRTPSFEVRLAVSSVPFPEIDPLEIDVGLLSDEALASGEVLETEFGPAISRLVVGPPGREARDESFLGAGGSVAVSLWREDPRGVVEWEVFHDGRLLRAVRLPRVSSPVVLEGLALPPGLLFVQAHGETGYDDAIGRHLWVSETPGPSPENLAAVLDAVPWDPGEAAWVAAARAAIPTLDEADGNRLAAYALARLDPIVHLPVPWFDSSPEETARADRIRETITRAMTIGIVLVGGLLMLLALLVGIATVQHHSRQRMLGTLVVRTAAEPGAEPSRLYDHVSWWDQHAVMIRGAFMFVIAAGGIATIAMLVYLLRAVGR
jgi:hypothetical protein